MMMSYRDRGSPLGASARRLGAGLVAAFLSVVVMVGCSGGGAGPSGSGDSGPDGSGSASPAGSLELTSPKVPSGADQTYTGVIRSDAIEGGCVYLQAADGQKYEVIPPDGWVLQKTPAAFVGPDGQVVARAGDVVTVTGHQAEMVSICQLGPIIQATDIVPGG